eukprot:jgi/Mesvir1/24962/Mv16932-RA.1
MATNQAYVLPDPKVEPFMGMKMRRSSSIARHLLGDYMQLGGNPAIHKLMSKQGDKTVLFADTVIKVNRQTKMQKRVLFVTEQALYLLEPVTYRIKRRVPLGAIEMLCLSEYSDNFFAVIIPSEYDYLLVSIHKTEIVSILLEATRKACDGQQPIVKIANKGGHQHESIQQAPDVRVVILAASIGNIAGHCQPRLPTQGLPPFKRHGIRNGTCFTLIPPQVTAAKCSIMVQAHRCWRAQCNNGG